LPPPTAYMNMSPELESWSGLARPMLMDVLTVLEWVSLGGVTVMVVNV
jgi:hypothetical protein